MRRMGGGAKVKLCSGARCGEGGAEVAVIYEICVEGHLGAHWSSWFDGLAMTHLAGTMLGRYVLGLAPLQCPAEDLVAELAPVVQRYLDGTYR